MTLLLMALAAPLWAQDVAWDIKASTTSPLLGEAVVLTGTVRSGAESDLALDLAASTTDYFSIASVRQEKGAVEGGSRVQRFKLEIIPLDLGKISVSTVWVMPGKPEPRILSSPPVFLDVREPALGAQPQLRDIKAPRRARPALWPWLLAAALGALAYSLWKRFRSRRQSGSAVPAVVDDRPAEAIAESELGELESSGLWAEGRRKEFYARLTDILRRYLERRYAMPATSLTTSEISRLLRHAEADRTAVTLFKDVFDRADLVKFAKIQPSPDWGPRDLQEAREIVRNTTPQDLAVEAASA